MPLARIRLQHNASNVNSWGFQSRQPAFQSGRNAADDLIAFTNFRSNFRSNLTVAEYNECAKRADTIHNIAADLSRNLGTEEDVALTLRTLKEDVAKIDAVWTKYNPSTFTNAFRGAFKALDQKPSALQSSLGLAAHNEVREFCTDGLVSYSDVNSISASVRAGAEAVGHSYIPVVEGNVTISAPGSNLTAVLFIISVALAGGIWLVVKLLTKTELLFEENRRLSESNRKLSNALVFPEANVEEMEVRRGSVGGRKKSRG